MASFAFDRTTAKILSKTFKFYIRYDTDKEGKNINSHVDVPEFSLGGLQWKIVARPLAENKLFGLWLELSEACHRSLAHGYEIQLTCNWTTRTSTGKVVKKKPEKILLPNESRPMIEFKQTEIHFEMTVDISLEDIHPFRLQFVDEDVAKTKKYNCKIVLEDDENKIVFVNKTVLAFNSAFFETLFFGDFQEKDQETVKLKDVKQEEFLEYLYYVYSPNRPYAVKKLEVLLRLADRFMNDDLLNAIYKFFSEAMSKENHEGLESMKTYRKPTLITQIIMSVEKTENIMDFVFGKAIEEPTFGANFVELFIRHLNEEDETKCDLREWIVSRVQKVFEREFAVEETLDPEKNVDENSDMLMRRKIGIVTFIGRLYVNELLTVQDMSLYIMDLVSKEGKNSAAVEASITCLALLLKMIGRKYEIVVQVASKDPNPEKQRPVRMPMVFYHLYNIKNRASDRLKLIITEMDNLRQRKWVPTEKSDVASMNIEENRHRAEADIECQREEMAKRAEFVDEDLAKKMKFDCKIVLEDDEDKIVFVNKTILAINSPFFDILFFGDLQEKDQEEVKLGDATEADFLEYLYSVYSPNRPLAVKNLEVLQRMADRFLNDDLLNAIEVFLR